MNNHGNSSSSRRSADINIENTHPSANSDLFAGSWDFITAKACHIYCVSCLLTGDEWDYIMSEVQGTLEFSLELHKFHNVDLFQRG
ncbi:unnamed protein product, partial [Lampetra planeri]